MKLYVAYGSNLNKNQMDKRCPDSICLGSCYLYGWELEFNHYATIERKKFSECPAGLWLVSSSDIKSLDIYEGIKNKLYEKIYVDVFFQNKTIKKVLTYKMLPQNHIAPSKTFGFYYKTCYDGYDDFKLDKDYLRRHANNYVWKSKERNDKNES